MSVTLINPQGLPEIDLYHQVAVATGSRTVFVAGQVGLDAEDGSVGDDLTDQTANCYLNVARALSEVGASFTDVVRLTVYLVDWTPEKMPLFLAGVARAAAQLGIDVPRPPLTGIGVAALAEPGLLVEIEATAVLD